MAKTTPSQHDSDDTMTHLEFFKRFKSLHYLEPSLGILGFFLFIILLISCFFYLDYRTGAHELRFHGIAWLRLRGSLSQHSYSSSPSSGDGRLGFLDEGGYKCDVFDGNWVWDESYPLYQSQNCSFMDSGFRCSENGRPDNFHSKWRWQPKGCNLPRGGFTHGFNAAKMLEKLRNRRLVFVGDSIGRNQWESLLCMLSSAVPNKSTIYEVNGSPITKHSGFLVFKFGDFNCTLEYYRAPFLVPQGHPPAGAPTKVKMTLRVDEMDWTSKQWRDADVLIMNAGHWWNHDKTIKIGCYFQEGNEVKMNMSLETAFRKSIKTVFDWIYNEVNMSKTYVLFRTYAPIHFRGGDWNTGGGCHKETLPDLGPIPTVSETHLDIVTDVLAERSNESRFIKLDLLNVTYMSLWRKDGHPSVYYRGPKAGPAPLHRQDCSHWCLPGVPDSWNVLLYALLLKKESILSRNISKPIEFPS